MAETAEEELTMEEKIDEILRTNNILIQAIPEARNLQSRQMSARTSQVNSARIKELEEKLEGIEKHLKQSNDEDADF